MWESQDAANYKLPALLTQTIVVLIPKDLDLCLKSQTDCLKIQPIEWGGKPALSPGMGGGRNPCRAGLVLPVSTGRVIRGGKKRKGKKR